MSDLIRDVIGYRPLSFPYWPPHYNFYRSYYTLASIFLLAAARAAHI